MFPSCETFARYIEISQLYRLSFMSHIFLAIINDSLISNRKSWCLVYANFRNFYDFRKFLGSIQPCISHAHKNSRVLILFINDILIDIIAYTYFYIYLSIFIHLLVKPIANITNRTSHTLIIISRESYHKKISKYKYKCVH